MKKIIIIGSTGFLGISLTRFLKEKGFEVVSLSRKRNKHAHRNLIWNATEIGSWIDEMENAYAWINLAGRSVDCRYTEKNKSQILNSRVDSTRVLNEALEQIITKPQVFLNSSTATIYDHSENRPNTEADGIIGDDFSMNVAKAWEKEFFSFQIPETRKVAMRTSIVLGNGGGAFPKLKQITALGLGGKQGKGNQMVSWIHVKDFCRVVLFILESELAGPVNVTAPNPLKNAVFAKTLSEVMNKSIAIPQPAWLLKLGAMIIGTETELLLKSRFVMPEKLQKAGYEWEFETVRECF
ncbi:MAG: TIGR01777 family oxidoreductase [Nonlabens sp.]